MKRSVLCWLCLLLGLLSNGQKKVPQALLCDTLKGICIAPTPVGKTNKKHKVMTAKKVENAKPLRIVYFTDPICSTCWGIEPHLRRLQLDYGHLYSIEYHMGGLLPKWEGFNGGGITKPSDVAHHWDEVSGHYQMPIDGDLWLTDPLPSSYPPSIAYHSAALQNMDKAHHYLRLMKEAVFMEKQNIARWPVQARLALSVGLDTLRLKRDMSGRGQQAFAADLALARSRGVRGFPTLFVENPANGSKLLVYGFKPYAAFVQALEATLGQPLEAKGYDTSLTQLFGRFASLTAKEYSVLSGLPFDQAEAALDAFAAGGGATVVRTKNGHLWRRR